MKIVNKRKFIKSIITLIFIIIITFICLSQIVNKEEIETSQIQYTVSKGETLWDIAKEFKQDGQDIREYIYEVKKINNMTSSMIYEGQVITIIK